MCELPGAISTDDRRCYRPSHVAHSPCVGSSKKTLSRIRGGGVVISKERLHKEGDHRKMRIAALPHRKAANLKKRGP